MRQNAALINRDFTMKLSQRVIYFSLVVCCALAAGMTSAAQQPWNTVGSSDMRWTVFRIYNITLLSKSGEYQPEGYPQALEIRYYRDIDKEDLVKSTGDQWAKLGISSSKRELWLPVLLAMWPDISANDTLRIEVDIDGSNTFLFNGKLIGSVDNNDFSRAFLDIWLSPKTTQPGVRKKLIGGLSENV